MVRTVQLPDKKVLVKFNPHDWNTSIDILDPLNKSLILTSDLSSWDKDLISIVLLDAMLRVKPRIQIKPEFLERIVTV